MSEPVDFPEKNFTYTAPEGMDNCGDLPCHRDESIPATVSCWQFDEDDLEELKRNGGKVYLTVYMPGHPPVRVSPQTPFVQPS